METKAEEKLGATAEATVGANGEHMKQGGQRQAKVANFDERQAKVANFDERQAKVAYLDGGMEASDEQDDGVSQAADGEKWWQADEVAAEDKTTRAMARSSAPTNATQKPKSRLFRVKGGVAGQQRNEAAQKSTV
jgi:hypothetical protein